MAYLPQGLRDIIVANQSSASRVAPRTAFREDLSAMPAKIGRVAFDNADGISRLLPWDAIIGAQVAAARKSQDLADRGASYFSDTPEDYNAFVAAQMERNKPRQAPKADTGINDGVVDTERPVDELLVADLPDSQSGYGLNSPKGSPVNLQGEQPEMTRVAWAQDGRPIVRPADMQNNGEEIGGTNDDDFYPAATQAQRSADAGLKDAPKSGQEALTSQYADIEKMLSKYTNEPKEDNRFTDFLKLTLARAAMSKDSNYLAALSAGAGQATFDQIEGKDKDEKTRMDAIGKLIQARNYAGDDALKREELEIRKPLYEAQADYYSGRAFGARTPKPTKLTASMHKQGDDFIDNMIGITRGKNRSITQDSGSDLSAETRQAIHVKAENMIKQGTPAAEAYDAAFGDVVGGADNLEEKVISGGGFFDGPEKKRLVPRQSGNDIVAEMQRRNLKVPE